MVWSRLDAAIQVAQYARQWGLTFSKCFGAVWRQPTVPKACRGCAVPRGRRSPGRRCQVRPNFARRSISPIESPRCRTDAPASGQFSSASSRTVLAVGPPSPTRTPSSVGGGPPPCFSIGALRTSTMLVKGERRSVARCERAIQTHPVRRHARAAPPPSFCSQVLRLECRHGPRTRDRPST
jgi:hypothetical protein